MFILTCFCMSVEAQKGDKTISGLVSDVSGKGLPAKVMLMKSDSTVLDTATAELEDNPITMIPFAKYNFYGNWPRGHYIVKAMMEGYEDGIQNFEILSRRQGSIRVKPIHLLKDEYGLPEVTIRATKVKMVTKGDTIIYNADAFNIPSTR